jgi:hypothetical protein
VPFGCLAAAVGWELLHDKAAAAGDVAGGRTGQQAAALACDRCAAISTAVAVVKWRLVGGRYWIGLWRIGLKDSSRDYFP